MSGLLFTRFAYPCLLRVMDRYELDDKKIKLMGWKEKYAHLEQWFE